MSATEVRQKEVNQWIGKASTLMEAMPYIRRFRGKRVVIKYGGSAMSSDVLKESFARDIIMLQYVGLRPVIVHGGGPQIGKVLDQMGIRSQFHQGLRITDAPTMDVVEMVLGGKINKEIVGSIQRYGGKAIGLSGKDGRLICAKKVSVSAEGKQPNEIIDLGHVGEVTEIHPEAVLTVEGGGFIPVVAPIGVNEEGESLNINADWVAAAMAATLQAEKLILLTDVEGVLDAKKRLISEIKLDEVDRLIADETVKGGMVPKLHCAREAIGGGVPQVHIIDGRLEHAVLLEMFTDRGVGTLISR